MGALAQTADDDFVVVSVSTASAAAEATKGVAHGVTELGLSPEQGEAVAEAIRLLLIDRIRNRLAAIRVLAIAGFSEIERDQLLTTIVGSLA